MSPAVQKLEAALSTTKISTPRIPVISNVDAQPHSDPETIKKILAQQVCHYICFCLHVVTKCIWYYGLQCLPLIIVCNQLESTDVMSYTFGMCAFSWSGLLQILQEWASERSHCWKGLWSLEVHFAKAWAGWLYLDVMQVTSPVQWETTLKTLLGKGLQSSYELGPGKVMSRLILLFICECVPHSALLHTWIFIPTVIANTPVIKVTRIARPTTGFPPSPHTKLLWILTSTCFFKISRHVVKDVLTWGLSWTLSVCHTFQ